VKVTQVPYRGAGPALVDLLGGQVDLSPIASVVAGPLIKADKMKGYVVIGKRRFAELPDVPTFGDLGYKNLNVDFWHMLLVPAGHTAPDHRQLKCRAARRTRRSQGDKEYAEGGIAEYPADQETPEAAAALLKSDIALWGEVVRTNHIAAQ